MRTLRAEIEKAGFSVWADEELEPGSMTWQQAIAQAAESTHCMVVIVTENTKPSQWIEREVQYARNHGKRIIPVIAADNASIVPFYLVTDQAVNIHQDFDMGISRLLAYIRGAVPPRSQLRLDRFGSVYWLGADIGQAVFVIQTADARILKRYLRQIYHHAKRLQIAPDVQERVSRLRYSTAHFSNEDWTQEKRKEVQSELTILIELIAEPISASDPDWEPFDPQNIREGLV